MEKTELVELAKKLGLNIPAVENHLKIDAKAAEKQIVDAAKFMGLKK